MTATQFRGSAAWKRARVRALRGATCCEICGGAFPPGVRPRSRLAPSVDHVVELARLDLGSSAGRAMAVDPANLRVVHIGCNSRRGQWLGRRRGLLWCWFAGLSRDWLGGRAAEVPELVTRAVVDLGPELSARIPEPPWVSRRPC